MCFIKLIVFNSKSCPLMSDNILLTFLVLKYLFLMKIKWLSSLIFNILTEKIDDWGLVLLENSLFHENLKS